MALKKALIYFGEEPKRIEEQIKANGSKILSAYPFEYYKTMLMKNWARHQIPSEGSFSACETCQKSKNIKKG